MCLLILRNFAADNFYIPFMYVQEGVYMDVTISRGEEFS